MSNKCGECLFFQGANKKCSGTGRIVSASFSACNNGFKGPASLFGSKKVCGGCRFFEGASKKCSGTGRTVSSSFSACNNGFAPIIG